MIYFENFKFYKIFRIDVENKILISALEIKMI